MEKILSPRSISLAFGLGVGALLMGACGSDESGDIQSPQVQTDADELPMVTAEYYTNGTRVLRYKNVDGDYGDIFQACDGQDLIEQTEFLKHGYGAAGNSMQRSVGHIACADGRLTPEDFEGGISG